MSGALVVMTEKSFGCLGVVGEGGRLVGIVTDGDLRRHMSPGLLDRTAAESVPKASISALPKKSAISSDRSSPSMTNLVSVVALPAISVKVSV